MNLFKNGNRKKVLCLIVGLIIFGLFLVGGTLGRYVLNVVKDFYLESRRFYFNSDKLTSNGTTYQLENWSGAEKYSISVNMNSFKNNKLFSDIDIDYNINIDFCSSQVVCEVSKGGGTISSVNHNDYFEVTVDPTNNSAGFSDGSTVMVTVSATSVSPYKKTLSATFVLKIGKIGLSYEIADESHRVFLDLNMTNTLDYYVVEEPFLDYELNSRIDSNTYLSLSDENKNKCHSAIIKLMFDPNVLTLDMTTSAFINNTEYFDRRLSDGHRYIYSFSFKMDALSSTSIRFYKSDITKNYSYPSVTLNPIIQVTY